MSDEKKDRAGGEIQPPRDEEEWVPADDAVIGRALRRSLLVLLAAALAGGLLYLLLTREPPPPPEQAIDKAPPLPAATAAELPEGGFTDVTAAAGVAFSHFNGAYGDKLLPESMGAGVAFFDYDADGDADLLLVNSGPWPHHRYPGDPSPTPALYRNDGGRFTDVTAAAGLDATFYGMGVAVGDFDNDGDPDLFLTAVGPNRLYRNEGDGTFTEVTATAGVAGAPEEWSTVAAFFDADGDGDLDLMVGNYVRWSRQIDFEVDYRLTGIGRAYGPPQNYQGTFPYLYRNEGDGTFTDVSAEAGMRVTNPATGVPVAKTLGLAPVDADGDGAMDVLVANDTVRNFFFHNRGDGTFDEVGELWGVAYGRDGAATGAMGADVGYYRNDAELGLVIGNFANEMSSVYVSQGDPTLYADEAISEGVGAPSRQILTFGLVLFDYDLDGRLDLLQVNGHLEEEIARVDPSQSYEQAPQLFWNAGPEAARTFVPVPPEELGDLGRPLVGRGVAFADVDGDGDLDLAITQTGRRAVLLRNDLPAGPRRHWLRLRLVGNPELGVNRDAIGARVELSAGGVTQRRQVMPTRSYISQVELPVTFGLGATDTVDALTVLWPDGSRQEISPPPAVDRLVVIEQEP